MRSLDTNIDGTAALVAVPLAAALPAFGLVTVAARLVAALGARSGIDGTLNDRRGRLGLNLWNRLGRV